MVYPHKMLGPNRDRPRNNSKSEGYVKGLKKELKKLGKDVVKEIGSMIK